MGSEHDDELQIHMDAGAVQSDLRQMFDHFSVEIDCVPIDPGTVKKS